MSVSIKEMDFSGARAKSPLMKKAATAALSDAVLESTSDLVPYNTGALRGSGEVETTYDQGRVIWGNSDIKYARVQYYEHPTKRMPGTVPYWFDVAKVRDFATWMKKVGYAVGKVAAS